jgi:trigger factor
MDFESSVVDIDEVTKQISVTVPKERVSKEYEASVVQVSRTAKIKGFRPGKVPRHMVERMMGDRIRYDVANRLINEGLRGAYEQHKLEVVGEPEVDLKEVEPAKALEFTAKVALYPQPTISNYLNRSVKVAKKEIGDKEVSESLERLRESKAELKPIEERKQAQKKDVVALSVAVQVEGGEASRPEPFVDELGLGKLPAAVEDAIVGMNVGDSRDIQTTIPEDHANADIRGKQTTHKVTLHGIFTKNMPELNDEFVKSTGMGVDTVDALKAKLTEQLTAQATDELKNETQGALLDLLVKENPFKVPQVLVDDEIRGIVARYGFAGRDVKPESIDVEMFRPQFEEFALNRIRCAIIIDRIGSLEEIKVEESDRDKMIQRIAEQNGSTVEAARKALLDKSRIMGFLLEVRRTKILEHLMDKTTVQYVDPSELADKAA